MMKSMIKLSLFGLGLACIGVLGSVSWAGNLDSPAAPTSADSALYTLEDIYNRLNAGTAGEKRSGPFTEPGSGPASTGRTTDEIMGVAPAADAAGATDAQVLSGKKYWGLTAGAWGERTGTMADIGEQDITPGTSAQTITQGYHDGTGEVAGDADLVTGNIKAGVNLFGVAGKTEVVDTTSGDAAAGDLLASKKAWVDGAEVTGTAAAGGNVNGGEGSLVMTIPDGLYTGSKTATAADSDLATGNIRAGVNLFGVAGDANVVNTSSGDATAAEILASKKAWVNGTEITGTMATRTLSAANQTVDAGYYAATTLSAVDGDLAAGNIKKDVNLFGVVGTLEAAGAYSAPVAKTGQTTSYATGDDGDLEKGVAWPSSRFTDNGNDTVTDNLTGLVWTKNANIFGQRGWANALNDCNSYTLAGGGWRLPNWQELRSLIDASRSNPALPSGHPFTSVNSGPYWSSTSVAGASTAWRVYIVSGDVVSATKDQGSYVWPVRGGQ